MYHEKDTEKLAAARDELLSLADDLQAVIDGGMSQSAAARGRGMTPAAFSSQLARRFAPFIRKTLVPVESLPGMVNGLMSPAQKLMKDVLGIDGKDGTLVLLPEFDEDALWDTVSSLTAKESEIMRMYYGGPGHDRVRTFQEIGQELDVTKSTVSAAHAKALRKLRHPARLKQAFPMLDETGLATVRASEQALADAARALSAAADRYRRAGDMRDAAFRLDHPRQDDDPARLLETADALLRPEPKEEVPVDRLPIEELDLSVRSYNCCKRARLDTVGDIVRTGMSGLMQVRNLGAKNMDEIAQKIYRLTGRHVPELPAE